MSNRITSSALCVAAGIMDFKHQITAPAGLAAGEANALVLVIADAADANLAAPLATLIADAVDAGDLVLKKGKLLDLYRPAGIAAGRAGVAVGAGRGAPRA